MNVGTKLINFVHNVDKWVQINHKKVRSAGFEPAIPLISNLPRFALLFTCKIRATNQDKYENTKLFLLSGFNNKPFFIQHHQVSQHG